MAELGLSPGLHLHLHPGLGGGLLGRVPAAPRLPRPSRWRAVPLTQQCSLQCRVPVLPPLDWQLRGQLDRSAQNNPGRGRVPPVGGAGRGSRGERPPSLGCPNRPGQSAGPEAALAFQGEWAGEGARTSCQPGAHADFQHALLPLGPQFPHICREAWAGVFSLGSCSSGVLRGARGETLGNRGEGRGWLSRWKSVPPATLANWAFSY